MNLVEQLSEEIIRGSLKRGPRRAILMSVIRAAARMLAETLPPSEVIGVLSSEIRRIAERENSKGVRRV